MKEIKIAIVVIGYNRPKSLKRLLNSLLEVEYFKEKVPLIISLDNSGCKETYKIATEFKWEFGEKKVLTYPKRLGLRQHILTCGDLTKIYENIIVLEDDLYVSPLIYKFSRDAILKYSKNEMIGGISLYSHKWNVNANRVFEPSSDGSDIYFHQFAQSWGQIWSKDSWMKFKEWYLENKDKDFSEEKIPKVVLEWPATSWLKYHIIYLIKTKRYFVYPKISLTTNFTEKGQHAKITTNDYQVILQEDLEKEYKFKEFKSSGLKYDSFFERENIGEYLGIKKEDICIDLYNQKENLSGKKFWLTPKILDYKIIKSYGLNFRPHEENIIKNNLGTDIFLYNTQIKEKNLNKRKEIVELLYDLKSFSRKKIIKVFLYYIFEKLNLKIEKIRR